MFKLFLATLVALISYLFFYCSTEQIFNQSSESHTHIANMTSGTRLSRTVVKTIHARSQSEGSNALVRRSIGGYELRNFTPFLMLDHFSLAPGSGFPDHPHRGQVTVTYMLKGFVEHEDFAGHRGKIGPGDLQVSCTCLSLFFQ
ncbi:RmlC-like cupin [Atractiella rhizophila]|nr:RmlC-like cupin [Atractiella rhizophila]